MKAASPYFLRAPPHVRSRTSIGFRVDFYQNRVARKRLPFLEICTHSSDKEGEEKRGWNMLSKMDAIYCTPGEDTTLVVFVHTTGSLKLNDDEFAAAALQACKSSSSALCLLL